MKNVLIKSLAMVVIAISAFADPALADPDDYPCTSFQIGSTWCEGCDRCYVEFDPFRYEKWTCDGQDWDYSALYGFESQENCDLGIGTCTYINGEGSGGGQN